MKLGLVIKITNIGVSEAYSINKNDNWARYASDVRPAINALNGFDGSGKSIILAKFLGGLGYLLCLIKARPEGSGRGGDNVSAWIHIPSNCDLSNSEVVNLLIQVESAISASTGIDIESLKESFQKEYITNNVIFTASSRIVSNNNNGFAVRYYNNGDYNLKELLGSNIAQKEYSSYQSILFVDKQMGITTQGEILDFEPKEVCTYEPISKIDGFTPYFLFNNGYITFDRAIEIPKGEQITIHWKKEGYAIIKKSFWAGEDSHYPQNVLIKPNEYKIIVKRDHFHIYDPNNVPVKNPEIYIDGLLMEEDSMEISESSYKEGVRLCIIAKGLADFNEKVTLSHNMQIIMGHNHYHYDFEIPFQVGDEKERNAIFSIETHHKLKQCPIQGYETKDNTLCESNRGVNILRKSSDWKSNAKFFMYGVASVFVVVFMIYVYKAFDNYEIQFGWPPIKSVSHPKVVNVDAVVIEDVPSDDVVKVDSLALAIKYLDGNDVWNKDSLEKFSATKDLFDDLNDFNMQNVSLKNDTLLKNSSKLLQIYNALRDNEMNGFDPRQGKEANGGRYNSSDDKKINVNRYIEWLSKDHSLDVLENDKIKTNSMITGGKKKEVRTIPDQGGEKKETVKNRRGGI